MTAWQSSLTMMCQTASTICGWTSERFTLAPISKLQKTVWTWLRPGGVVMNHGITSSTFNGETMNQGTRDFIEHYVFPGGELTHVSTVMEMMSRQNLECLDVENLRPHYARTLWHWVERLDTNKVQACQLVGEEKYRIWRTYMMGFAYAFEQDWENLYQILAVKPLPDRSVPYPFTREHMYR